MNYFPLFHQLQQRHCLIVGGGNLATRRGLALASAGAVIDVISPVISDNLREVVISSGGQYWNQTFAADQINSQYACIVAATDKPDVNEQVAEVAERFRIPVNLVCNPARGSVIFPAIIDREPLTIAISNSGSSPVLSRLLKQQIELLIPTAYGELSSLVGRFRKLVSKAIPDSGQRAVFWESVLQGRIAETLFSGHRARAEAMLAEAVQNIQQFEKEGEVYLIGAGPGDPDLLTLRAFRLLQQAEVVLYDRLVSEPIMALVNERAERVYVGKRRSEHAVPQDNINELLVKYARQGKRVARLKGGDPFIFGRGGEEIETLAEEGIAFQVVPGITAANGCSAYAGIPLTHRDYAQSVQFVTGQLKNGSVDLNWPELVRDDKTLVFYMGLSTLPLICQGLTAQGMAADMPVALIEKGTTPQQRVLISTLADVPAMLLREQVASPSLFIVGRVVSLAGKLDWFQPVAEAQC